MSLPKRPPSHRPSNPAGPPYGSASHHRRSPARSRSALNKLDLDSAFFWLLLVFLLTVFTFLSLRDRHVQLNPNQVAEYERRSQFLSNSTVYIIEVSRPEGLLTKLSANDWTKISADIDFVAFVFDDLPLFLTDDWVAAAERVLLDRAQPHAARVSAGVGVALFPCGCVIPNEYFRQVDTRLGGYECLLLPGWVLPHEDVHWLDVRESAAPETCKRRQNVLAARMTARYRKELKEIHEAVDALRQDADANVVVGMGEIGADDGDLGALRGQSNERPAKIRQDETTAAKR